MVEVSARIISNKKIKGKYFKCVLNAPRIAKESFPGQFIDIRLTRDLQPLLRRPFSISKVDNINIEILYEVRGEGTKIFSKKKSGEYLDIIGPLGNGFDFQSLVNRQQSPVLVAGGMGVAPLLFLAEKLKSHKVAKSQSRKLTVLIGAKTKSQILCENDFKKLGYSVKIATDDGSGGFKGKVTELLRNELSTMNQELTTIYACGPRPMLKAISKISREYKISAQISLEEHMACGIGACLGCVVNTKGGFKRVCKEGPVFKADEIIW
jgi:dihydroorotate dehydrogenase electron transfer subunit